MLVQHIVFAVACAAVLVGLRRVRHFVLSSGGRKSFKERMMYKIDHALSTNPEFKTYALLAITLVLILAGGILYQAARLFASFIDGEEEVPSFFQSLWASWAFLLDNGAHLDEKGSLPVLVSLGLSIAGMLLDALLVGLVADALGEKMDDLKKGKSKVLEEGHTLILGWNDKLLPLIKELAVANESEGGGVIVVLSEREKEGMEEEIASQFDEEDLLGTVVVCRSGNPMLVSELEKVSADRARSIVALAQEGDPDAADAKVPHVSLTLKYNVLTVCQMVRIVLALCGGLDLRGHVVSEMRDIDNCDLVRIVGQDQVETVVSHDIIGRLMIQCARQRGLATTYERLLGFEGHEFYFQEFKHTKGKSFGELGQWFPNAIPCGYKSKEGTVFLNPPADYVMQDGDELLAICEDDSVFNIASTPDPAFSEPDSGSLPDWKAVETGPEKILFCGWRRDLDDMITELDKCVSEGSELHILSSIPTDDRHSLLKDGGLEVHGNLKLLHRCGSPVMRRELESLNLEEFSSILILAEQEEEALDVTAADSRSMATLLLIRDIQAKRGQPTCTVISEITDPRTKQLIAVAKISDYVVSNELVSMALAMVAENREINVVLQELWTADGSEVFVRSACVYVAPGEELSFYQVARRALSRREVLLGYRRNNRGVLGEVVLNPDEKGKKIVWDESDEFVVLAVD